MAQQTIKDAIGAQIQALLQALVTTPPAAPGPLSLVQRPVSGGMMSSPQNQSCYILQGNLRAPEDELRDSSGEHTIVTAIQPYDLNLFAVQSDSATTPVDSILNQMEAAVRAAILTDDADNIGPSLPTLDLCEVWFDPLVTYFRNAQNANIFGVALKLLVEFRHPQNCLYLPTE